MKYSVSEPVDRDKSESVGKLASTIQEVFRLGDFSCVPKFSPLLDLPLTGRLGESMLILAQSRYRGGRDLSQSGN